MDEAGLPTHLTADADTLRSIVGSLHAVVKLAPLFPLRTAVHASQLAEFAIGLAADKKLGPGFVPPSLPSARPQLGAPAVCTHLLLLVDEFGAHCQRLPAESADAAGPTRTSSSKVCPMLAPCRAPPRPGQAGAHVPIVGPSSLLWHRSSGGTGTTLRLEVQGDSKVLIGVLVGGYFETFCEWMVSQVAALAPNID